MTNKEKSRNGDLQVLDRPGYQSDHRGERLTGKEEWALCVSALACSR